MTSISEQLPKNSIKTQDMMSIVQSYDLDNVSIGMLASHSALDLADGAKDENFQTVAVCQSGREKTYQNYDRIIDKTIVLNNFKEMLNEGIQKDLKDQNVIFVPNRSFTTYILLFAESYAIPTGCEPTPTVAITESAKAI